MLRTWARLWHKHKMSLKGIRDSLSMPFHASFCRFWVHTSNRKVFFSLLTHPSVNFTSSHSRKGKRPDLFSGFYSVYILKAITEQHKAQMRLFSHQSVIKWCLIVPFGNVVSFHLVGQRSSKRYRLKPISWKLYLLTLVSACRLLSFKQICFWMILAFYCLSSWFSKDVWSGKQVLVFSFQREYL